MCRKISFKQHVKYFNFRSKILSFCKLYPKSRKPSYLLAARARPPEHTPAPPAATGSRPEDEGPAPGEKDPPIEEDLRGRFSLTAIMFSQSV